MGIWDAFGRYRHKSEKTDLSAAEERYLACFRRAKTNKDALSQLCGDVDTLVMGSSHALWGYVAEGKEFNLAEVSGDFRLCLDLLRYWHPRLSVNRVLLFYDTFSAGNVMDKSPDWYRLIPYLSLYGIERAGVSAERLFEERRVLELLDLCARPITAGVGMVPQGWRGNLEPVYYGETGLCNGFGRDQLVARVKSHVKLSQGEECRHIEVMRELLAVNHGELVLIVPPVRDDYLQLFRKWHPEPVLPPALVGCRVLNFMGDAAFGNEDFVDCDHLNRAGACKLSRAVRNAL